MTTTAAPPATLAEAFLADILAHPDDDTPRLVMADWLEDGGQAERAEFIRVQCEIAAGRAVEPERHHPDCVRGSDFCPRCQYLLAHGGRAARLLARGRELLAAPAAGPDVAPGWVSGGSRHVHWGLRAFGAAKPYGLLHNRIQWVFRRGFVNEVILSADDWLRYADVLTAAAPLTAAALTTLPVIEGGAGREYRLAGRLRWQEFLPRPPDQPIVRHAEMILALLGGEWPRLAFTLPDGWQP